MEDRKETEERVCVGAVLVRNQDRHRCGPLLVLLGKREAKRAFYPGVWDVLGGHLEPGETAERALIRELREEAGVTPMEWRLLGEFREALPGGDGSIVLHLYAVTSWTGVPRNHSPREHSAISWFAVEDACRLPLAHPAYRKILRTAVSVATGTEGEKPA
jgi:8-oxo-dGTP diphosphatase